MNLKEFYNPASDQLYMGFVCDDLNCNIIGGSSSICVLDKGRVLKNTFLISHDLLGNLDMRDIEAQRTFWRAFSHPQVARVHDISLNESKYGFWLSILMENITHFNHSKELYQANYQDVLDLYDLLRDKYEIVWSDRNYKNVLFDQSGCFKLIDHPISLNFGFDVIHQLKKFETHTKFRKLDYHIIGPEETTLM
ncbi:MAG TPA: hypothetical protein DCG19_04520 [Cryomorphaceae bacterium]|nr:hypothetical protein [Cryomorphaceae bacterium]|tara:strand:- start:1004 stop:1585 length:582 start_codon:yes stop_codon:yes gene_type:complete